MNHSISQRSIHDRRFRAVGRPLIVLLIAILVSGIAGHWSLLMYDCLKRWLWAVVITTACLSGHTMGGERQKTPSSEAQSAELLNQGRTFVVEEGDETRDKHRFYAHFAKLKHADLNEKTGGKLNELFDAFGKIGYVYTFFDDHPYPGRHKVYQEFLIQALENSAKGDVGEAMFVGFLLSMTPRKLVLETIVPEMGPGGRLEGILDHVRAEDVKQYVERQNLQGHPGERDFRHYARYLDKHRHQAPPAVLIEYMFRTDPGKALLAIANLELWPADTREDRPARRKNKEELRQLLWAEHVVQDVVWKQKHGFLDPGSIEPEVFTQLDKLSKHQAWWVRLYVAETLRQHPLLRKPKIVRRLQNDKDALVQKAIQAAQAK